MNTSMKSVTWNYMLFERNISWKRLANCCSAWMKNYTLPNCGQFS